MYISRENYTGRSAKSVLLIVYVNEDRRRIIVGSYKIKFHSKLKKNDDVNDDVNYEKNCKKECFRIFQKFCKI